MALWAFRITHYRTFCRLRVFPAACFRQMPNQTCRCIWKFSHKPVILPRHHARMNHTTDSDNQIRNITMPETFRQVSVRNPMGNLGCSSAPVLILFFICLSPAAFYECGLLSSSLFDPTCFDGCAHLLNSQTNRI